MSPLPSMTCISQLLSEEYNVKGWAGVTLQGRHLMITTGQENKTHIDYVCTLDTMT